ncbi:MAG: site-specific DNA-methyltransferase, partial [Treponema sp.]|nr:site-specific DNA-methyltransferase [Treponema sp.]
IDDNEVHHLRMLMDEIFGEQNFVTNIVWQARKSVQNDTDISQQHNHILVYAKNRRQEERRLKESNSHIWYTMGGFVFRPLELDKSKFSNPDNDPRGPWKADPFDAPNIRPNLTYPIVNPNTGVEYLPPNGRHWRTEEDKYKALLKDGRIIFGTTGRGKPQLKVFWEEKKDFGEVERTWWGNGAIETYLYDEETEEEILNVDQESAEQWTNYGTTTSAIKMLQQIFETKEKVFETPKPVELIKHIIKLATKNDAIILDSFAGSGTTGHAVLELNYEDEKSNRKFILIEMEDYADAITAERIRRVIKGVPTATNERIKNGLGGTFSYFELGSAIEMEDILKGENLPEYRELARYIFYTATGNEFDESKIDEEKNYIGENDEYEVYLFYKPDIQYLKTTALDLDLAKSLGEYKGKKRLVFAPMKYLDNEYLLQYRIEYCQLPFEIYRFKE